MDNWKTALQRGLVSGPSLAVLHSAFGFGLAGWRNAVPASIV